MGALIAIQPNGRYCRFNEFFVRIMKDIVEINLIKHIVFYD